MQQEKQQKRGRHCSIYNRFTVENVSKQTQTVVNQYKLKNETVQEKQVKINERIICDPVCENQPEVPKTNLILSSYITIIVALRNQLKLQNILYIVRWLYKKH